MASKTGTFIVCACCAALVLLELFVREHYGAAAAYRALPYLIGLAAAYSVYLFVRLVSLIRRMPKRVKTQAERRQDLGAYVIGFGGLVVFCLAPIQPWTSINLWALLSCLLVLIALIVPQLISNRRTHGTWLVRRPLKQPPPTGRNQP